jgi:hypothetical protein
MLRIADVTGRMAHGLMRLSFQAYNVQYFMLKRTKMSTPVSRVAPAFRAGESVEKHTNFFQYFCRFLFSSLGYSPCALSAVKIE